MKKITKQDADELQALLLAASQIGLKRYDPDFTRLAVAAMKAKARVPWWEWDE